MPRTIITTAGARCLHRVEAGRDGQWLLVWEQACDWTYDGDDPYRQADRHTSRTGHPTIAWEQPA